MFDIVHSYKKRDVVGQITLQQFLEEIKSPGLLNSISINSARNAYNRGDMKTYKRIKDGMPSVGFNFTYDSYVNSDNIIKQTGYLYIDVDCKIDKFNLKKDYVVACWDSLSQRGCGILISVSGVTTANLKEATREIADDLGVSLDVNAVSIDRLNVISQDSNPYINNLYSEYSYTDNNTNITHNNHTPNTTSIKNIMCGANSDFFQEGDLLKLSNEGDLYKGLNFNGETHIVLKDDVHYTEIFLPPNIKEGKRNISIFSATSNCRGLNPNAEKTQIKAFIYGLNSKCCNPPLPIKDVSMIVERVFSKEPVLYSNKKRKILFNPDYDLTKKQKLSISAEVRGSQAREKTITTIYKVLDEWDTERDGKKINKNIAKKIGKHPNTLSKYTKEIKKYLKVA